MANKLNDKKYYLQMSKFQRMKSYDVVKLLEEYGSIYLLSSHSPPIKVTIAEVS